MNDQNLKNNFQFDIENLINDNIVMIINNWENVKKIIMIIITIK